ncbi:MAG: EamA family transporter [Bacteroidota bacterium]
MALVFISIVWGTTYLGIRVGAMHYPAFLFAGVRQVSAGIILMSIALLISRQYDVSRKNVVQQMIVGFMLITMGNGLVTWGEKYVPSGIAALICSMMPICAVIINLSSSKKEHFNLMIGIGMLLGFAGVGLIFKDNLADLANKSYLLGIICVFTATFFWSLGSIRNKKSVAPINAILNSGMQLFFGGVFLLLFSPVVDTYKDMVLWQPEALMALVYLIIFGSVLAYAAYMFALSELPVGVVTLYAYINPLVAVLVGYLVLHEQLTWYTALAITTIIVGVFFVNKGYRKAHKSILEKELLLKPIISMPESAQSE